MVKIGEINLGKFPLLLAPMEDVTNPPFRYVCKMFGADLMYTEFISSEGLIRDADKSVKKLDFEDAERPIGIQIFGHDIESMTAAARYAEKAHPDLIDINFGCPVKKVVAKGAGSGILNDIPKMVKMTAAVVKAVNLPVTVKTRLGYDEEHKEIVDIAERLQDVGIQALAIHGRTRTTRYSTPADWTLIGEVKNNPRMYIPIFGNGDVNDPISAKRFKETYGVDGLMIGRAVYGNPWIFREIKYYLVTGELMPPAGIDERVKIGTLHLERSVSWKGERRGILEIRKHWSAYFRGLPDFKPFRIRLMEAKTAVAVKDILQDILQNFSENI
ncbi:tRNA-dihydrouridine synthase DusB [hydrothermal vent metagenome]|uniref:tRNA-dihydrouridine synthase DusB n=1 Tax=hydrothermal vent metagenome TaxID=652676 RepID=A0A3B0UPI5_9ZZZZ